MVLFAVAGCSISIHALRVEGDRLDVALRETQLLFCLLYTSDAADE